MVLYVHNKFDKKESVFMKIKATENGITVYEISNLSLQETLDCGQCFRWKKKNRESEWGKPCNAHLQQ